MILICLFICIYEIIYISLHSNEKMKYSKRFVDSPFSACIPNAYKSSNATDARH